MAIEDVKNRFLEEIKLRAFRDKYVDRNEEREILPFAIQQGMSADAARAALAQVCEAQGYVLESTVLREVRQQCATTMGAGGAIDRSGFELIVGSARRKVQGKKDDLQVKRLVVEVMEDAGLNKVKKGWFGDWYAGVKKEVGYKG
jgi:hypothetical protein